MITTKNYLITIVGPTAIGKTALSIQLAKHFNSDIVSADSRQFFKEMQIGTAVPNIEELVTAPHHFIQNMSIFEDYNVGKFEQDAIALLNQLFTKNNIQIMVGGSGLYVDAVINGLDDFPKIDSKIREQLIEYQETKGLMYLQEMLLKLDETSYQTIAIDNPQRLIRALEICLGTGKPYSTFKNKKEVIRNFIPIKIGLTAERSIIYDRINQRVDLMIANGLVEEAKKLHPYKHLNALQTVGYKELFSFFDGENSLDIAVEEIKKNTRRFAKRQLTWFRKDPTILWFDYQTPLEEIIQSIHNQFID